MMASGAGVLSTPIVRVIDPRNYVFSRAVDILAYAVLGGVAHWSGPIVGAAVLTVLPEWLRFLQERRDIVNGLLIMVSIIFLPRGLADPKFWGGQARALPGRRRPPTAPSTPSEMSTPTAPSPEPASSTPSAPSSRGTA
jgi:branched-chain amino acid transport system permease protein